MMMKQHTPSQDQNKIQKTKQSSGTLGINHQINDKSLFPIGTPGLSVRVPPIHLLFGFHSHGISHSECKHGQMQIIGKIACLFCPPK